MKANRHLTWSGSALDDEFGLSALFNDMTPPGRQIDAELLLSAHPFLKGHGRADNEKKEHVLNAGRALLYSHASASWKAVYTSLRNSLLSTKPPNALGQQQHQQQESTAKAVDQSNKAKRSRKK
jgi:hypothetical protein